MLTELAFVSTRTVDPDVTVALVVCAVAIVSFSFLRAG